MPKRAITDVLPLRDSVVQLPQLGLGVGGSRTHICETTCLTGLKVGYRQIDTAQAYGNEKEVGLAVQNSGIPRKDIFVTTKIMHPASSLDENYQQCLESVQKLDVRPGGYVDCFLIHNAKASSEARKEMWQALERLFDEGRVRSIGVSNYGIKHIEEMREYARVWPPHVNQIEVSIG